MINEQKMQEKKDSIRSELFRFVSVRPPGRKDGTKSIPPILYDEKSLAGTKGSFFGKLDKLGESKSGEIQAQLQNALQTFKTSAGFVESTGTTDTVWKGFADFYKWFSGANEKGATIAAKLKSFTGKSATDHAANTSLQSRLWDNYFFYLVEGTNPRMIQALTELLRVYAIAERLLKGEGEETSGMERAGIVLPKSVLMLIVFGEPAPETVPDEGESEVEKTPGLGQLTEEVRQMEKVRDEIRDRQEMFLLPPGTADATDRKSPEEGLVSKKIWDSLSKPTRTFLETAGFGVGRGKVAEVIEYLDAEIAQRYELAFSGVKRTRRLVLIGSSLVETGEASSAAPAKKAEKRSAKQRSSVQETLLSMYNSWWSVQDPAQLLDIQIGDFKRVEQETECYVPGEVAHIENILKGEHKSRKTRRFTRTEDVTYSESETTEENERDVQTTDRFEMEKETSNVISTDTNVEAGLDVSADYGVVKLNATAGFSFNIATENSNRQATEYAKSVTERALSRMVKRIKETRTSTIIKEYEDKNTHGIDNKEGEGNVVGIYRWVDKIYKVSLLNYGRRMMIKFNIIEPSRYYQYTQSSNPFAEVVFPVAPDQVAIDIQTDGYWQNNTMVKLHSFRDINDNNYAYWAKIYGATVNPAPSPMINIGKAIAEKLTKGPEEVDRGYSKMMDHESGKVENLIIPAGYEIKKVFVRAHLEKDRNRHNDNPQANVYVGNMEFYIDASYPNGHPQKNGALQSMEITQQNYVDLGYKPNEPTPIPIVFKGKNCYQFVSNIVIRCSLTKEAYETWQRETYEAIIGAYQTKLAEAEYAKSRIAATVGIQIKGRNPLANKAIIETELKKGCIDTVRIYTHPWVQHYLHQLPGSYTMNPLYGPYNHTPLHQVSHGRYINFMEECFEWSQMTYKFHPYYWAEQKQWKTLINLSDTDPLFENFLKSGSSTVVVPVRPGYEKLFAYYLHTGQLWMGEDVPLTSELNAFIDTELGDVDPNAEPEFEACWNMKLPTNLVILQKQEGGLDESGLPCFDLPTHSDNCGCD